MKLERLAVLIEETTCIDNPGGGNLKMFVEEIFELFLAGTVSCVFDNNASDDGEDPRVEFCRKKNCVLCMY